MHKCFLKPIKTVLYIIITICIGLAASVAQLTGFNFWDYLIKHSPQSFCILVAGILLVYFVLVLYEYFQNKQTQQLLVPNKNYSANILETVENGKILKGYYANQQSIISGGIIGSTIIQHIGKHHDASPIVDQKIKEELEILRKSRFFTGFDTAQASIALARRLVEGELSNGSDIVRSRAIAWCSRLLSRTDVEKAEEYLKLARTLGSCLEIEIAEAFISSQRGDKHTALIILGNHNLPLSRSAALMIVAHHEGSQEAIDWLDNIGCSATELDSDGKYSLLSLHLQLAQWEAAQLCVDALTDDDLSLAPALHHIAAITHLIRAVPDELRTIVLNQVPFNAAVFPLAAETSAIEARRKAQSYFTTAGQVALQFGCSSAAKIFDEFSLWLEIRDPDQSEQGIKRLKEKLRDLKSALHLIRLGLQFGIKLDLKQVEDEIERQIALYSGITQDAAIARFALIFTHERPEDAANYIARHREQFDKFFDRKSLQFMEIELLSKAGMPHKAKERLNTLMGEGLSESEENHLRSIIDEIDGVSPVEACKQQFKETNALEDLMILVVKLEERGEWSELCEYGEILFKRTHSLRDAERLAKALSKTKKYERLTKFLVKRPEFLAQSKNLHMLYCWALYYEGDLPKAHSELSKLNNDCDNSNYRALQVNLGVALGDWNSLNAFVAKEYADKEKRSAQELMSVAHLAHYLGSPHAKELTFAAVEKGNDDAGILAEAYYLATSAGWEDSVEVFKWINKAAEISDENGPILKKSLKDIVDMQPDWERRETEILRELRRGDIPMFLAGEALNRSLIQMMLFPALANQYENDPRRRGIIPAYSGKRQSVPLKTLGTVAMDPTVLLTLSLLKLLDKALDACETVYIPHSTLIWLFEEKQKASFHQPSRIRDAHKLQSLLAEDVLEKLIPNTVPDSDLSAQVGDELALLIAEAKKASNGDTQWIVVRPYPVHRISSLMEEEVDLAEYADMMSSCQAIVDKLRSKGQITIAEEKKARAYLQLNEKPWPNQPEIADRATLYLEDLALTYFLHLGLLEKLKAAGFRLIASPRKLSEANELTSYEYISGQVNDAIEQIRSAVNERLVSGKIKVGRKYGIDELERQSVSRHPTIEIIDLARECEAIFVDDRSLNQHAFIGEGSAQVPILSTLELLDMLASIGSISTVDLLEYRTILRRAGYFFIPVYDDELAYHLNASAVKDNKVIETAELKAIRENILHARMVSWLQLPRELFWLDAIFKTFIRVLISLWIERADFSNIRTRSNWILSQYDIRGWIHCIANEARDSIINDLNGAYISLLLIPLTNVSQETKEEYWNWIENVVLVPIKEQHPNLYSWIIEYQQKEFANVVNMSLPKEEKM